MSGCRTWPIHARLRATQPLVADAYEAYRRSLRLRPRASEVHERFGWFLGGVEGIRLAVRRDAVRDPIDPRLATVLGSDRSVVPEALAHFQEAVRWDPHNANRHRSLGLFDQRGEAAGAFHEYRTASAVGGEDWSLHWTVARALRDGGYLREAITSYEVARRLRPTEGDLGAELGDLYARIGLADQAIGQYRQVLRREPDPAAARRGLASVKVGAGS